MRYFHYFPTDRKLFNNRKSFNRDVEHFIHSHHANVKKGHVIQG